MILKTRYDARWRKFGTLLGVSHDTMEIIDQDNPGKSTDCLLALVGKWMSGETGTGNLPRNWTTVVEAMEQMGLETLAKECAK